MQGVFRKEFEDSFRASGAIADHIKERKLTMLNDIKNIAKRLKAQRR